MQVRVSGEFEDRGGVPVPVRSAKQRALLALQEAAGQRDRLIDVLW